MKRFKQFYAEQKSPFHQHLDDFVAYCCEHLGLDNPPHITYLEDKTVAMENASFGGYRPGDQSIEINIAGRHPADIFRTLAHELTHYKQDLDGKIEEGSGETGSDVENEANAQAAVIMRNYGKANRGIYESFED